ncbi:hypothetical protein K458DRAFT_419822 [Lentithecium fluviatile CBS 122367]|uniref:Uncharacterized protein n=1 Tax=Lentithecium fluviatile CBS 122367 TaxID=1168545 RepID=A0A6G1IVZ6_9PLEO|nr:hypothetical protein K458DRAFT_419822 [Lentithecium fluviatile CBS 122367]
MLISRRRILRISHPNPPIFRFSASDSSPNPRHSPTGSTQSTALPSDPSITSTRTTLTIPALSIASPRLASPLYDRHSHTTIP